jgi:endo-1,4-beta-xylanase
MRKVTDAAAVRTMMLDHIDHVASHFSGRVAEWDVINEPMSDDDIDYTNGNLGVRPILWFEAMGENYLDLALAHGRAADPSARLFINEYGVEEDGPRWDALLALVKRLQARGAPLDGIGFQVHEYTPADRIAPATLQRHVQALATLGLVSRISEMDVLVDRPSERSIQATEYAGKLAVCRQEPSCSSFSSWGITDRYGSTADVPNYPPPPGDALIYDDKLAPKPAYDALRAGLMP